MVKNIKQLIAEARLDQALEALKNHPQVKADNQLETQIIMISARLARNQNQEQMGLIPLDVAMRERNAISHSLLSIADQLEPAIDPGGSTSSPIIAPPIQEADLPENAPTILFLASDPRGHGKLQLEREFMMIQNQLSDRGAKFKLKIKFEPRADTLTKVMLEQRPSIVHFSGHGTEEMEGFSPAGIVLENRDRDPFVVPGPALANMFKLLKRRFDVKLVLLNACVSMDQAKEISSVGCYAIGMADEIPDNMAVSFASGFYLGLAESPDDYEFAFEMAKNSLLMEGIGDQSVPAMFKDGEKLPL